MRFYVNKNRNNAHGDNEVHREDCHWLPSLENREDCHWLPSLENREYLGFFSDAIQAVAEAKRRGYPHADGCAFCCPEAHKH